jgi:hypothetical protein
MKDIKDTLLNSSPIVEVGHKHDVTYSILPLGEWIVEALREGDENGEPFKGTEKAHEGRVIKNNIAVFKLDKACWKEVTSHYSAIRKDYEKSQRDLMKSLDVRSARHWTSGKITVSLTPDAVEAGKVDSLKPPLCLQKQKTAKAGK